MIAEVKVTQRMTEDGEMQGLRVIAENVFDLATMRKQRAKRLKLACNGNASAATARARSCSRSVRATSRSPSSYRNERVGGEVELSEDWRVNLDDALIDRLREWLAPENVEVVY